MISGGGFSFGLDYLGCCRADWVVLVLSVTVRVGCAQAAGVLSLAVAPDPPPSVFDAVLQSLGRNGIAAARKPSEASIYPAVLAVAEVAVAQGEGSGGLSRAGLVPLA